MAANSRICSHLNFDVTPNKYFPELLYLFNIFFKYYYIMAKKRFVIALTISLLVAALRSNKLLVVDILYTIEKAQSILCNVCNGHQVCD